MEYILRTDKKHIITLTSHIDSVRWLHSRAAVAEEATVVVRFTHLGNGSQVNLRFLNAAGKVLQKARYPVFNGQLQTSIRVPEKTRGSLICEVVMIGNSSRLRSEPLQVLLPRKIDHLRWDRTRCCRGDVVAIHADTQGIADAERVTVVVYDYDRQRAHSPIARFQAQVRGQRIEQHWRFEYPKATRDLLTGAEEQQHHRQYAAPKFFFAVELDGQRFGADQSSGFLEFDQDLLDLSLLTGSDLSGASYRIDSADGSQRQGQWPPHNRLIIKDISPGPALVTLRIRSPATTAPQPQQNAVVSSSAAVSTGAAASSSAISRSPAPKSVSKPVSEYRLPHQIQGWQNEAAANSPRRIGFGWAKLSWRASLIGLATSVLTSGSVEREDWQEDGQRYLYLPEQKVLVIHSAGQTHIQQTRVRQYKIVGNELVEYWQASPEAPPRLGATHAVIDANGKIQPITAAAEEDDLRWRTYQADGGDTSFQVWLSSGKPVEVEVGIIWEASGKVTGVPNRKAGAGGSWPVVDEIVDKNVVAQANIAACGPACGEMLLESRGIVAAQGKIGKGLTTSNSLAKSINANDPNAAKSAWVGSAVTQDSFAALNNTGSWAAMMWDKGTRVGHWVVVDGLDDLGRVMIKDPWRGTSYKMTAKNFFDYWAEHAVYKQ